MSEIRRWHLISLAISLALFPTLAFGDCTTLKGLYEKRVELLRNFERTAGHDYLKNKERADAYKKQIEIIDNRYRGIIHEMFFENERKEYGAFSTCCGKKAVDKYLFFVCKLIAYYRDDDANFFLNNIPLDKDSLEKLWQVDAIILSDIHYYAKPHPKAFDRGSFVDLFLIAVYELATKGNAKAIDRFLAINQFADGIYAEFMEDKIFNLFDKYPDVIARNWGTVKKYRSTMQFWTTDFQFRADSIIQKYKNLCSEMSIDSSVCMEVIEFLKEREAVIPQRK